MSFARPQNPVLQVFDQAHLYEELEGSTGRLYGGQTLIHYIVSNNGIRKLFWSESSEMRRANAMVRKWSCTI